MSGSRPAVPLPRSAGGPACSTASRADDESLAATAGYGRRWLLVEIAGAWGRDALTDSPALDPALGRRIAARAHHAGVRAVAIRRPGRARGADRWRWAVADSTPGAESVRWGEVAAPHGLLDVPLDGSAGAPSADPVVLVCAHGRHDECCAVRGRVVASAMAARYPAETWECSHLGGDRFAATTLLLPHGLSHGRVDDLDGPAIVDAYRDGRVSLPGFRGRTAYPRIVQAAQHAVRSRTGDDRLDALAPRSVRQVDDGWVVQLEGDPPVSVDVSARSSEPMLTTCRATRPVAVPHFTAVRAAGASRTAP